MDWLERALALAEGGIGEAALAHLRIAATGVALACALSIPLAAYARRPGARAGLTSLIVSAVATVPPLALAALVLLAAPDFAVLAFVAISALPTCLHNIHDARDAVPPELREIADAIGLPRRSRLRNLDLPLGLPHLVRGLGSAAVAAVAATALAALIGGDGFGRTILRGLETADAQATLEGAAGVSILALSARAAAALIERLVRPRGMP